ncbi:transmembrane anchor protein [Acinetobacter seifertii]|uniref:Transmembrane anchor protein n=1 Tax=Acinetobacter seifertii TaxID=1530123 RepID=A0A7H2UXR8_9GAMM|nr:transmembrane anchor protein [Acinetobacter seifertii]MBD1225684.1 transmembrane anchor protein [Acinetobacter seifertii]QNX20331.1 transmembrane anchor protein [Acinetobacter seifertii]QNX26910.1 transmembrane anchor protein [Acinetobacter seifertii]QNX37951.1 transmembrane anchor protein [Acinetobacter seifertii]QNX41666.1 transmembrane anchor protein [Acinetobacter seifertii]
MYNSEIPKDIELPSSKKLIKSTAIATVSAVVVLVTCVMPAEYAIDPTGMGKVLGLTKMGEIKQSLAEESENGINAAQAVNSVEQISVETSTQTAADNAQMIMPAINKESISIELKPGQATEVKLTMPQSASVNFDWKAVGGGLNYDTHGDPVNAPKGFYHGYGKGKNETTQQGVLKAAFDGKHGWFWRNRTENPVTVTLLVEGQFSEMKKVF